MVSEESLPYTPFYTLFGKKQQQKQDYPTWGSEDSQKTHPTGHITQTAAVKEVFIYFLFFRHMRLKPCLCILSIYIAGHIFQHFALFIAIFTLRLWEKLCAQRELKDSPFKTCLALFIMDYRSPTVDIFFCVVRKNGLELRRMKLLCYPLRCPLPSSPSPPPSGNWEKSSQRELKCKEMHDKWFWPFLPCIQIFKDPFRYWHAVKCIFITLPQCVITNALECHSLWMAPLCTVQ